MWPIDVVNGKGKSYEGSIYVVLVDKIAEIAGWKGKHNNQPNHTAAVEVELPYEAKEGSHR